MKNYIAIDIAKDTLQVQSESDAFCVANNERGITELLGKIDRNTAHVVCEATGGYERLLVQTMHDQDVTVSLINAARARAFANSDGLKAKTDAIDAQSLLDFAQQKNPRPTEPQTAAQRQLRDLLDRRSHLTEQIAREKNRLQKSPKSTRKSIERMIKFVEGELKKIEKEIEKCTEEDDELKAKRECLESITGVGKTTALTVLAYLSEIETLGRGPVAALAGVAPFNRDSGKFQGKRRIQGGRAQVRKCLFMAAQSAARYNPVIKAYVQGLRARGKSYKSAITAAMRKILLYMKTLLNNLKNPNLALES
jgi:transposase